MIYIYLDCNVAYECIRGPIAMAPSLMAMHELIHRMVACKRAWSLEMALGTNRLTIITESRG